MYRLSGFPPFFDDDNARLFEKIKAGHFSFPSPVWDTISVDAKQIIANLLVVDPTKRLSCEQLMTHPWILGETSTTSGSAKK